MLGLKLIHVSKGAPVTNQTQPNKKANRVHIS